MTHGLFNSLAILSATRFINTPSFPLLTHQKSLVESNLSQKVIFELFFRSPEDMSRETPF